MNDGHPQDTTRNITPAAKDGHPQETTTTITIFYELRFHNRTGGGEFN